MHTVSVLRLYILRAMYLFIVVGLATLVWPDILSSARHWGVLEGQTSCMLAAFSLLCLLGVRYPLQMLPMLLWETLWKTMWLLLVPFPQWRAGHVDPSLQPAIFACSLVALVYLATPWGYVYARYVKAQGDSWRGQKGPSASGIGTQGA